MKTLIVFRRSLHFFAFLLVSSLASGQTQQKFEKAYPVHKDVTLKVDARHTELVFKTWNRNELGIEAYIDTKGLSKEEISKAMAAWEVKVKGDKAALAISSTGSSMGSFAMPSLPSLDSLRVFSAQMLAPMMTNMAPMLEKFSGNPLPPEFMESLGSIKFDHEAYQREGEKYLERWDKEMEEKFGPKFEAAMEEWSRKVQENSEVWSTQMEAEMETWGKALEEDMEKWGEQFGASMEIWGEEFGKQMEQWAQGLEDDDSLKVHRSIVIREPNLGNKVKKTMIVRLPKDAILNLNVRYGEVQLPELTTDLRAHLSHSKLTGETIRGSRTSVNASYTPVFVKDWEYGVLNINYVQNCRIGNAVSLKLNSVSSDVKIDKLQEIGIISGTFANLILEEVSPQFRTLDLSLENSDLHLDLPETALRFNYTGSKSNIKYPSSIKADPVKSYDSELINGFQKSEDSPAVVNINAKFSDIIVR